MTARGARKGDLIFEGDQVVAIWAVNMDMHRDGMSYNWPVRGPTPTGPYDGGSVPTSKDALVARSCAIIPTYRRGPIQHWAVQEGYTVDKYTFMSGEFSQPHVDPGPSRAGLASAYKLVIDDLGKNGLSINERGDMTSHSLMRGLEVHTYYAEEERRT